MMSIAANDIHVKVSPTNNTQIINSAYINNNGVKIYYEVVGDRSKPTLLMVHGNGNCVQDWHSLGYVASLSQDVCLVLVDGRGYGNSDKLHEAKYYTPGLVASDYIAVLDHLGIKQCHYFGNSRGGNLGFIFGQLYPDRFLSFVIASSEPFGSQGVMMSAEFVSWLDKGIDYFVLELEKILGRQFPPQVRKTFLNNDPKAMIAANANQWPNYSKCFQNCNSPVLLLVGELAQEEVADNKKCLPLIKNGKLEIVPKYTHAELYWHGEETARYVKEFLRVQSKWFTQSKIQ